MFLTSIMLDHDLSISELVCGMCEGIDMSAYEWAAHLKLPVKEFPADWDKYGRAAGPIRNAQMAEYADIVVAIWDGKSKGTSSIIREMKKLNKPVIDIRV